MHSRTAVQCEPCVALKTYRCYLPSGLEAEPKVTSESSAILRLGLRLVRRLREEQRPSIEVAAELAASLADGESEPQALEGLLGMLST
jgi:hypothetical protein